MPGLIQPKDLLAEDLPWLSALREKGRVAFEKNGVPTAKTEDWKYTKPRDLNASDFVMNSLEEVKECACGHHHENCGCECHCHNDLPFDAYVFHFSGGLPLHEHNSLPRGVVAMTLAEAFDEEEVRKNIGRLVDISVSPFAALNTAYLEHGLYLCVERGIKLDKPLVIVNHTHGSEGNLFYNLRNLIIFENGAEAELVEYYHYSGAPKSRYFANIVSEIFLSRNSKLNHYKLQNEAFKANHVALTQVQVKADAVYNNFCFQKGANIGRNEVRVKLIEKNALTSVDAAYKMSGWAVLDTTTIVEHLSPDTFSSQLVKGVVDGESRGVFQGKIHIAPGSIHTKGQQLHRALLLSDTAEVDVKPELEIFADDVKCSHGAASGELDEEQLFYMRSRGIDENEARRILVEAFLDDVLSKIENEEIRSWFISQA